MKNTRLTLLAILIVANVMCYAQRSETVKSGNVESKVTTTDLNTKDESAYGTSKSKEALDYAAKATGYADKNDLKNAAKYYLLAIKADPDYVQAYDNLGVVYRRMGNFDDAIEKYKQSIKLYPNGKAAHQNLAAAYGLKKQYDDAAGEYDILLKLDPNDPEGYFGYANLRMLQAKYDDALTYANQAKDLYQKQKSPLYNDAQYLVGLIYYYKGDKPNAIKNLKLAKKNGVQISPALAKELKL